MEYTIHPIAHIRTDFTDKFGIPRQSGLVPELTARIVFEPEYRDPNALVGIEGYDRLWLIWQFSTVAAEYAAGKSWRPTVRPPRLGGNERRGVFATRSPYRPNALGLSCVELAGVENGELIVRGADLLDGTPIFDIKPYLPYVDAYPDARGGFTDTTKEYALQVVCPDALLCKVPENKRAALSGVLKNDPRPAYQHDPERVYTLDFGCNKVKFTVDGGCADCAGDFVKKDVFCEGEGREKSLPSQGRWPRSRPEGLLRFAAAVGRGGVKTPPYGAKDTWAVMAKSRAGYARPLQTALNEVPTRGAREGGSPPSFPLTGCRGRLRAAYMPPLQSCRSPLRGFGGTPEFKVEEGAGALRTDSNTASV